MDGSSTESFAELYERIANATMGRPTPTTTQFAKPHGNGMMMFGGPSSSGGSGHTPRPWWDRLASGERRAIQHEAFEHVVRQEEDELPQMTYRQQQHQHQYNNSGVPLGRNSALRPTTSGGSHDRMQHTPSTPNNVCTRLFEDAKSRDVKLKQKKIEIEQQLANDAAANALHHQSQPRKELPSVAVNMEHYQKDKEERRHMLQQQMWRDQNATFRPAITDYAKEVDHQAALQRADEKAKLKRIEIQRNEQNRLRAAVPMTARSRKIAKEMSLEDVAFLDRQQQMSAKAQVRKQKVEKEVHRGYAVHFVMDTKEDIETLARRLKTSLEMLIKLNPSLRFSQKLFKRQMLLYPKIEDGGATGEEDNANGKLSAREQHALLDRLSKPLAAHEVPEPLPPPPKPIPPRRRSVSPTNSRAEMGSSSNNNNNNNCIALSMNHIGAHNNNHTHHHHHGARCTHRYCTIHSYECEKEMKEKEEDDAVEDMFHPKICEYSRTLATHRKSPKPKKRIVSKDDLDREMCSFRPSINRSNSVGSIPMWGVNGLEQHKSRMHKANEMKTVTQQKLNYVPDLSTARTRSPNGQTYTIVRPFQGVEKHHQKGVNHRDTIIESLSSEQLREYRGYPMTNYQPPIRNMIERSLEW